MREKRVEIDWANYVLVALMVTFALWAVIAADWTDGLYIVWAVGMGGLIAGLALSASRFPGWIAHGFAVVYGLAWEVYWLSWQITGLEEDTFRERLVEINRRLGVWLWQMTHNEVSRDSLIFVVWLAFLAWWVGYFAIWYSQRVNRVWRVVLPSGLVLLVNVYYYIGPGLTVYLLFYLLFALLVVARSYAMSQEQDWRQDWVGFTPDFRFDVLQAGFTLALIAVLAGWSVPAAASNEQVAEIWHRLDGPWRRVEDTWSRLFSSLRARRPVYANPFGRFLTLSGARVVAPTPVMDVWSTKGSYWRATTYNQYTGSGWVSTQVDALPLREFQLIYLAEDRLRQPVTQTFAIHRPALDLLFAASQPARFDISGRIETWSPSPEVLDLALASTGKSFKPGTGYRAISMVSIADANSLRQAGQDYPDWVRERYLDLPGALPERVRELAKEISAPYDNPYDKATALEQWMRANVVYDDQISPPPQGRDVVDYLLFESRRGYCDYYASGLAVMARAVGLPARVVAGYARGELDRNAGAYRVQEKDSHSWVEIYFPAYGWIEFEPTSAQPVLARPTPRPDASPTPDPNDPSSSNATRTPRELREGFEDPDPLGEAGGGGLAGRISPRASRWLIGGLIVVGVLLLGVAGFLAWAGFDSWSLHPAETLLLALSAPKIRWSRTGGLKSGEPGNLYGLSAVQRAYARLIRVANWLRVILSPYHTPHERGELFSAAVPEGRQAIMTIVGNYTYEQYGRGEGDGTDSREAWESVRSLLLRAGWHLRKERFLDIFRGWLAAWRRFSSQFG